MKAFVLIIFKLLGLFELARFVTRRDVRILCYHGFQVFRECQFRPQLFISKQTFADRLKYLEDAGYVVVALDNVFGRGEFPRHSNNTVVITIDDGFASTHKVALPLLAARQFPATVYVTTYYSEKQVPVFRLALQYLFWKASLTGIPQASFLAFKHELGIDRATAISSSDAQTLLIRHGESLPSELERQGLLFRIGQHLGLDSAVLSELACLKLMSEEEIRDCESQGVSIQLHTHRHRFPIDNHDACIKEVVSNRERLERILGKQVTHFCYPSGIFDESQWPLLDSLGVESATTCLPGMNDKTTPRFGLRRFLDSERISAIEFEAEMCGLSDLLRRLRGVGKMGMKWRAPSPD